jgi:hypothetical protein
VPWLTWDQQSDPLIHSGSTDFPQTAGVLVAKAPALLACTFAAPGELNRDLKSHVDAVQEVG